MLRLLQCSRFPPLLRVAEYVMLVILTASLVDAFPIETWGPNVIPSVTCEVKTNGTNTSQVAVPILQLAVGLRAGLPAYLTLASDHSRRAQLPGADERLSLVMTSDPWAAALYPFETSVNSTGSAAPVPVIAAEHAPAGGDEASPAQAQAPATKVAAKPGSMPGLKDVARSALAEAATAAITAAAAAMGLTPVVAAAASSPTTTSTPASGGASMSPVLSILGRMETAALPLLRSTNESWQQHLNAIAASGDPLPSQLMPVPIGRPGGSPAATLLLFYRRDWWERLTTVPSLATATPGSDGFVSGPPVTTTAANTTAAPSGNATGMPQLPLPPTWSLFMTLVSDLMGRDLDGDGLPDHPLCIDLMPGCKGGALLAAIYATLAQTHGTSQGLWFNLTDFTPLLDGPALPAAMRLYGALAAVNAASCIHGNAFGDSPPSDRNDTTATTSSSSETSHSSSSVGMGGATGANGEGPCSCSSHIPGGGSGTGNPATVAPSCTVVNPLFEEGRCLFTVDWANAATWLDRGSSGIPPGALGVALLPGSERVAFSRGEGAAGPTQASANGSSNGNVNGSSNGSSNGNGTVATAGNVTMTSNSVTSLDGLQACTASRCPYADAINRTSLETLAVALNRYVSQPTSVNATKSANSRSSSPVLPAAMNGTDTYGNGTGMSVSLYLREVEKLPDRLWVNRVPFIAEGEDSWVLLPPAPAATAVQALPGTPSSLTQAADPLPPSPLLKIAYQTRAEEFSRLVAYQLYLKQGLLAHLSLQLGPSRPSQDTTIATGVEWDATAFGNITVLSGVTRAAPPAGQVTAADVGMMFNMDPRDVMRLATVLSSAVMHRNAAMDISLPYSSQYRAILDYVATAAASFYYDQSTTNYRSGSSANSVSSSRGVNAPPSGSALRQRRRRAQAATTTTDSIVGVPIFGVEEEEIEKDIEESIVALQTWAVKEFTRVSQSFPYTAILLRMYAHAISSILPPKEKPEPPAPPLSSGVRRALSPGIIVVISGFVASTVMFAVGLMWCYSRSRNKVLLLGGGSMPGAHPYTTFVVTDVQGSTTLWEVLSSDLMDEVMNTHHRVVRQAISDCKGYEVFTEGDAFAVAFHLPEDALDFAVGLQAALLGAEWPPQLLEQPDCCEVWTRRLSSQTVSPSPARNSKRSLGADPISVMAGLSSGGGGGGGGGGFGLLGPAPPSGPLALMTIGGIWTSTIGATDSSTGGRTGRRILNAFNQFRRSSLESSGIEVGSRPLGILTRFPKLATTFGGGSSLPSGTGAPSIPVISPGGASTGAVTGISASGGGGRVEVEGVNSRRLHRWFSMPFTTLSPAFTSLSPTPSIVPTPSMGGGARANGLHSALKVVHPQVLTSSRSSLTLDALPPALPPPPPPPVPYGQRPASDSTVLSAEAMIGVMESAVTVAVATPAAACAIFGGSGITVVPDKIIRNRGGARVVPYVDTAAVVAADVSRVDLNLNTKDSSLATDAATTQPHPRRVVSPRSGGDTTAATAAAIGRTNFSSVNSPKEHHDAVAGRLSLLLYDGCSEAGSTVRRETTAEVGTSAAVLTTSESTLEPPASCRRDAPVVSEQQGPPRGFYGPSAQLPDEALTAFESRTLPPDSVAMGQSPLGKVAPLLSAQIGTWPDQLQQQQQQQPLNQQQQNKQLQIHHHHHNHNQKKKKNQQQLPSDILPQSLLRQPMPKMQQRQQQGQSQPAVHVPQQLLLTSVRSSPRLAQDDGYCELGSAAVNHPPSDQEMDARSAGGRFNGQPTNSNDNHQSCKQHPTNMSRCNNEVLASRGETDEEGSSTPLFRMSYRTDAAQSLEGKEGEDAGIESGKALSGHIGTGAGADTVGTAGITAGTNGSHIGRASLDCTDGILSTDAGVDVATVDGRGDARGDDTVAVNGAMAATIHEAIGIGSYAEGVTTNPTTVKAAAAMTATTAATAVKQSSPRLPIVPFGSHRAEQRCEPAFSVAYSFEQDRGQPHNGRKAAAAAEASMAGCIVRSRLQPVTSRGGAFVVGSAGTVETGGRKLLYGIISGNRGGEDGDGGGAAADRDALAAESAGAGGTLCSAEDGEGGGDAADWRSCVAWDTSASYSVYGGPEAMSTPSTCPNSAPSRAKSPPPPLPPSSSSSATRAAAAAAAPAVAAATTPFRRPPPLKLLSRGRHSGGNGQHQQQLPPDRSYNPGNRIRSPNHHPHPALDRSYHPGPGYRPTSYIPAVGRSYGFGIGSPGSPSIGPQSLVLSPTRTLPGLQGGFLNRQGSPLVVTQRIGSALAADGWFSRRRRYLLQPGESQLRRSVSAHRSLAATVRAHADASATSGGGGGSSIPTGATVANVPTSGTPTTGPVVLGLVSPGRLPALAAALPDSAQHQHQQTAVTSSPDNGSHRGLLQRLNASLRRMSTLSRVSAGSASARATISGFAASPSPAATAVTMPAAGDLTNSHSLPACTSGRGVPTAATVAAATASGLGGFLADDTKLAASRDSAAAALAATAAIAATPENDRVAMPDLTSSPGAINTASSCAVYNDTCNCDAPTADTAANAAAVTASAGGIAILPTDGSTVISHFVDTAPVVSGGNADRPAGAGHGSAPGMISTSLALTGHHNLYHVGRSSHLMTLGQAAAASSAPPSVLALAAGASRGSLFMDMLWRDINMAASAAAAAEGSNEVIQNQNASGGLLIGVAGAAAAAISEYMSAPLLRRRPDGWMMRATTAAATAAAVTAASGAVGAMARFTYTVASALRSVYEPVTAEGVGAQLEMYGNLAGGGGSGGGCVTGVTRYPFAAEPQLVLRGLRLRMGLHSGPSEAEVMLFAPGGAAGARYLGQFLAISKDVCDSAAGGMVLASGSTFRAYQQRLREAREARGQRGGGSAIGGKFDVVLMHLGEYLLGSAPATCMAEDNERQSNKAGNASVPLSSGYIPTAAMPPPPPPPLPSTVAEDVPAELYGVVSPWLVPRLAILPSPVRARHQAVPGCLSAPAAPVFCNVLGVETLLAWERVVQQRQLVAAAAVAAASTASPVSSNRVSTNLPPGISIAGGGGTVVHQSLEIFRRAATAAAACRGGYIVAVSADGGHWVLVFGSASSAVAWGLDMLDTMIATSWPDGFLDHELTEEVYEGGMLVKRGLRLRIGVDLGCAMLRPVPRTGRLDYVGRPMNRAARIAAKAKAATMFISGAVWDAARGALERPVSATCLGLSQLKGVREQVKVWALRPVTTIGANAAAAAAIISDVPGVGSTGLPRQE